MGDLTVENIVSSFQSRLNEIGREEKIMEDKTKMAVCDVKKLLTDRKTMVTNSPDAVSALDSALCGDVIGKYTELQMETENFIKNAKNSISTLSNTIRKHKAVSLLARLGGGELPPECVFLSSFTAKSRNKVDEEHGEYAAACVRVGGEYAVAMRRGNARCVSKIPANQSRYVLDDDNDKVFPEESRNEFVLDRTYPLVGFEDIAGTTHAVFLTGLSLRRSLPRKVPAAEPNCGLHEILIKGFRVAKIPALCLFERAEDIPNIKLTSRDKFFVPDTQPIDEDEYRFLSETIIAAAEEQKVADEAPNAEQRVYVYEFNNGKANGDAVFSLSAIQADEIGNSWCNINASRSAKCGGFSGEKDGFGAVEMNDVSCFSDCIDVSVYERDQQKNYTSGAFPCCISIESGRRLFEANPAPFTKKDVERFETNGTAATAVVPGRSSSSSSCGDEEENSNSYGAGDNLSCGDDEESPSRKNKTTAAPEKKRRRQGVACPRGICKFKMDSPPQEVNVVERLAEWNENKYKTKTEVGEKNSWWCSYSPPLKIESAKEDQDEEANPNEDEDDDERAEACAETETAVRAADILSCISSETEVVASLHETIISAFTKINKASSRMASQKLERVLKELDNNRLRHPGIWSKKSMRTARGLIVDEASASAVAQQISNEIAKTGVLEGICNESSNVMKTKYEGQRRYTSGNKAVNLTTLKLDGEREIDAALKEWVKSKLPPVPTFPNVFSMRSSSLITTKKRTAGGSDNDELCKKIIKTEKGQASPRPFTPSADCYSTQSSSPRQRESGGVCDYVYISPPSFIKSPRINNGDVADHLADIFGRRLCGMKRSVEVYQNMCAAVNGLKERLMDAPFRRFNTFHDFEKRLFNLTRAEEIERAAMEVDGDEDGAGIKLSVLDYESERLGKLLRPVGGEDEDDGDWRFFQKFNNVFENSHSWCLGDEIDPKAKVALTISTMRRVYEEYYAYKKLAYLFLFNKLKKELEGDDCTHDSALATAFGWYCAVVARNRICDVFRYVSREEDKTEEDDTNLSKTFIDNLAKNNLVVSIVTNKIIESLRWMINVDLPSGYLKGLLDNKDNEADEECVNHNNPVRKIPCETIDETARFVAPEFNIGSTSTSKAVRVGPHVVGPIFIKADFSRAGLTSVKYAKLFINCVTGKGLLTISPKYNGGINEYEEGVFPLAEDILGPPVSSNQSLFFNSNKTKLLPTFLASPSRSNGGASKGSDSLFDKRSFQGIRETTSTTSKMTARGQISRKKWCYDKFEDSINMWRCGFVVTKKLCEIIFKHRGDAVIIGEPNKKSKMTNSLGEACLNQSSKGMEKTCKSISYFTKRNPSLLAKNLEACSPSEIDVKIVVGDDYYSYIDDATTPPLATCNLVQEEYARQLHNGVDSYCSAFFNFTCKSAKYGTSSCNSPPTNADDDAEEEGVTAPVEEEDDDDDDEEEERVDDETSRKKKKPGNQHTPATTLDCNYVCDTLQNSNRIFNSLRKLKSRHISYISAYRKKMK